MDQKRLEDKLDKISDKIGNIDVTLARQEVSLSEHIRRTNLLEEKLKPIEKHVAVINGGLKFVGIFGVFVGILEGIIKILGG